jgi:hypothetical protein
MALAAVLLKTKSSGMWRCVPDVVSPFHGQEVHIFLIADVGMMIFRKVQNHSSSEYWIQGRGPEDLILAMSALSSKCAAVAVLRQR